MLAIILGVIALVLAIIGLLICDGLPDSNDEWQ
jgi:hypothetical protein